MMISTHGTVRTDDNMIMSITVDEGFLVCLIETG